jgi:HK97 family phage major capsid protein
MDDLRSLREQRDELRSQLDAIMERNDSIDDTESIEALEKGTARMAELDASIRSAEAKARYNEMRESAAPTYSFRGETTARANYDGEYRFVMDGNNISIEGREVSVGGTDPSSSLPGMVLPGNSTYDAAIPVDLQAELIRRLPKKTVVRNFFNARTYGNDIELQRVAQRVEASSNATFRETGKVSLTNEEQIYILVDMELERVRVNNFKTAARSIVTEEFMRDARGRAVAELLLQHAEEHGVLWDALYANGGGGTAGPAPCWAYDSTDATEGIQRYIPSAQVVDIDKSNAISTSGTVAATEVVGALTELRYDAIPAQYWGGLRWMMDQASFAIFSKIVDANGRPLFQPLLTGTPADSLEVGTILGLPVYVGNNLGTSAAAGDTCAILAHAEDYNIFDRTGFSQQVDPYSEGDTGKVVYRTRMRSDGRWLRPFAAGALVWVA